MSDANQVQDEATVELEIMGAVAQALGRIFG